MVSRTLTHTQHASPLSLSAKVLFVLYEHAAGYALFRCRDVEDIGSLLPEVQAAMTDFSIFTSVVTLEAFSPFKTGANALENINAVSEGVKIEWEERERESVCVCVCVCV